MAAPEELTPCYDFVIRQGTDEVLEILYAEDDGTPIDLTGYTVRAHFRTKVGATPTLLELESDTPAPGVTFDPLGVSGIIRVTLSDTLTSSLTFSRAVWDMKVTSPGGLTTRILHGGASVSLGVTQ